MKQNFLVIAAVILAGVISFVSCKKDSTIQDNNLPPTPKHEYAQCANPANPYDDFGYFHNFYLNQMIADSVFVNHSNEPVTTKEINEWINTHTALLNQHEVNIPSFRNNLLEMFGTKSDCFIPFVNKQNISGVSKATAKKIVDGVLEIYINTKSWNYDQYYKFVRKEENAIMQSPFYANNPHERQLMLSFTSTMRYSLYYWSQVYFHDNPLVKKEDGDNGRGPGLWGVVLADVVFGLASAGNPVVTSLASGIALFGAWANDDVVIYKDENGNTHIEDNPNSGNGNGNGNGTGGEGGEGGGNGNGGNGNGGK